MQTLNNIKSAIIAANTTPATMPATVPAKPKRIIKTPNVKAAKPSAKPDAKAKAEPAKHFHRDAGLTGSRYSGPSSYLNANRKTAIKLSNYPRTADDIAASPSNRTPGTLYELREIHGTKTFPARGIDNAIAAMLITADLLAIVPKTGSTATINGVSTLIDIPGNPLRLIVTATGLTFGKA